MIFNDKLKRLEIVFEDFDTDLEKRFIKSAFENIKAQAMVNKTVFNLAENAVLQEPKGKNISNTKQGVCVNCGKEALLDSNNKDKRYVCVKCWDYLGYSNYK